MIVTGPRLLHRSIRCFYSSKMAGPKKKRINLWSGIDSGRPAHRFVRYLCGTLNSDPGNTVRNWRVTTV